jgi:hypothetical protein
LALREHEPIVETSDDEALRHYDIHLDWDAFDRLSYDERVAFGELVESLERGTWLNREDYPKTEWACIDLSDYADYGAFVNRLKKQGASFYEDRKAEKRGFYSKFFDERTFIGDVVAINTSTPERQGKPMTDPYLLTVEQRGGYPTAFHEPTVPPNRVFWLRRFGTFRACPGHRQGSLVVDEQLVSYLSIRRFADFAIYNLIIGHHDFLRDGVVHKMHLDFVKTVLDTRNRAMAGANDVDTSLLGLRYIGYAAYFPANPGLKRWKKSNNFRPGLFRFDGRPAASRSVLAAELATLRRRLADEKVRHDTLKDQLEAETTRHSALQAEAVVLRDKAERWDEVKGKIPTWRGKAERYDKMTLHRIRARVRRALARSAPAGRN